MRFPFDSTPMTSLRARLAARRERTVSRAARQVVEQLERRQLLAVVNAGEVGYFLANGTTPIRVAVVGEGSITLVGASRPTSGGGVTIAELPMTVFTATGTVRTYNGGFVESGTTPAPPNYELYSIYSGDSTSNTSVVVSAVTPSGSGSALSRATNGSTDAFGGTAGSVLTNMIDPGDDGPQTISLNNGGVFIGARSTVEGAPTNPATILEKRNSIATSAGVRLSTGARLEPGIFSTGSFDNLFIGGTISGAVDINGSVDTMYAGNVVTGNIRAGGGGVDNFNIGGDLRNLIVSGSIGTLSGAPDAFFPGTDIQVGGRVQQVRAGGEFRSSIDVVGNDVKSRITSALTELESRAVSNANRAAVGAAFENFQILNQGFTNNDVFDRPQILGTFYSSDRRYSSQAVIDGSISNVPNTSDNADYYGMPLLAGQTVRVQLTSTGGVPVSVQVFDPDGNMVASDQSNQNLGSFAGQAFLVHADQPGLWRLAIVPQSTLVLSGPRTYRLTVDRLGEMGMGGLAAGGDIYLANADIGVRVRKNDLGAIIAAGDLYGVDGLSSDGTNAIFTNPIVADRDNIRSVEATNLSNLTDNVIGLFPNIIAGKSVGLVRANGTAPTTRLYFNYFGRGANDQPSDFLTIGGDYQVIETAGDFSAILSANGGIGVIRVGSVGLNGTIATEPGYYEVNADGTGNDGFIGLIDVARNFGTFINGGPAISSANGSNVRYIRVGGEAYRDRFFGAGDTVIEQNVNGSIGVTDDSGARITITPIESTDYVAPADQVPDDFDPSDPFGGSGAGGLPDPFGGGSAGGLPNPFGGIPVNDTDGDGDVDEDDVPTTPVDNATPQGTVTVETYPIRGTGGSVILSVTTSEGVLINTAGSGATAQGDISNLITGTGTAAVVLRDDTDTLNGSNGDDDDDDAAADPFAIDFGLDDQPQLALNSGTTNEVLITGIRTNVYDLSGTSSVANYTRIINSTSGEILNITANSVGYLEAQYLGVGRTAGGVTVEGQLNVADARFNTISSVSRARNLIQIGNAIDVRSRGPMGNIASNGIIQNLVANSDDSNERGVSEGIVGPVFAAGGMRAVEIGEGLATSGNGTQVLGGLFTAGGINAITNGFGDGDLRGDVIFGDFVASINLTGGGSIVDSDILQASVTGAVASGDERVIFLIQGTPNDQSGIGTINVSGGNGGIINSQLTALNFGRTIVGAGGFGVFSSTFFSSGGGTMAGISAAGLGIRSVSYTGGSSIGDIVATGGGRLADINDYSSAVTAGDTTYFDPVTGLAPNASTDLFDYFQTGTGDGEIIGVTNEGILSDSQIAASQAITSVRAFDIRAFKNPLSLTPNADAFPTQINFGQSIGNITTKRDINGLSVTGANLGSLVARDISNFRLQTTAGVGTINAKRNVLGSATFNLINESSLQNLRIGGNFSGILTASQGIDSIIIDGDFGSQRTSGGLYSGKNIRQIRIGGDVREGAYLRAKKKISGITINKDLEANSTIRANPFGTITIKGSTNGKIQRN